jgi:sugar/nucleoside kinase (ribokinase family)
MYDVFGLGNALVDTEVNIDDGFLHTHRIAKGHMTLVDSEQMHLLAEAVAELPKKRSSGGSAANTIYAVQALGLQACYNCKVAADDTGNFFIDDLAASGVTINTNAASPVESGTGASGRCLVLITDDAERTMMTDLGVSVQLSKQEVSDEALKNSRYFYVEGYMSASPSATEASVHCRELAEAHGVEVAVSLSDVSMVEFCREGLQQMLGNGIHQLFCNEEEALSWANTDRMDIAIAELKDVAQELYITLGAKGSIAISRDGHGEAPGISVQPIDTTGAGDIYAGAVLAARCQGASPLEAARFANFCAAQLVTHYGARLKHIDDYTALRAHFT